MNAHFAADSFIKPATMSTIAHRATALAAATLLSIIPVAQAAAAQASASFSQLSFQLIDLDPNDQISPSISITPYWTHIGAADISGHESSLDTYGEIGVGNGDAGAVARLSDTAGSVQARLPSDQQERMGFGAIAWRDVDFTLSPHTAIVFTALAHLETNPATNGSSYASLSGKFYLDTSNNGVAHRNQRNWTYTSTDASRDYSLFAQFASSDQIASGKLRLEVLARTDYIQSAVPEPGTWGMLAAGLLVLAGRARKRLV